MINKLLNKFTQPQFNTRLSIAGDDIFDFTKFSVVKEIESNKNFFSRHPIVIVADPFLFVQNEDLFLFYEEQVDLFGKGLIKMTKTSDFKNWSKPVVVLEEEFHLSYPNVFKIEEQIYMMPETGEDKCIKLYKPNDDLTEWKLYKTLLKGRRFVDSSIVFHNNKYFLFTTDYSNGTNTLRLYYSNSINDEWIKHPKSPITEDANKGRCAGSLFFYNDILYRPSQRCEIRYGAGVDIYQVLHLDKDDYSEERCFNLIPNSDKFYKSGGHHFNLCEFKGEKVVATDGIEVRLNFFEIVRRVGNKIKQAY